MSLKRVLDTARQLGIPVVITDDEGEASQVVMPFDDFAALVGATSPVPHKPKVTRSQEPTTTAIQEDEVAQALADLTMERINVQAMEAAERLETEMGVEKTPEGFLEEKFYLEPIDDNEGTKD